MDKFVCGSFLFTFSKHEKTFSKNKPEQGLQHTKQQSSLNIMR